MFNFTETAQAIVDHLEAESQLLEQVSYIDQDFQSERYPARYPAAFVTMDKVGGLSTRNRRQTGGIVWAVVIRGKRLDGLDGVLAVIDDVCDVMAGFEKFELRSIEFFDVKAESVAWIIRYQAPTAATIRGCNNE